MSHLRQLIPSQVSRHSMSRNTPTPSDVPLNFFSQSPIGDDLTTKHPNHFRLLLQNPNGFSYENDLIAYQLCLHNIKSISTDIALFPETNLHWSNYNVQSISNRHRRHIFDYSKQITSNSTHTYNSNYQPGGTCSLLLQKMVGRHHSSFSDSSLGRWTVTNLSMRNNQILSIICCYQVCQGTIVSAGPKTAFSQQWSLLKQQGHDNPNPRKQFYTDLDKLLSKLISQNNMIILAGDFNASVGNEPHGLDRIVTKFNLCDTIQYLHGPYSCASYSRGSKCIDYIFCSHSFLPAIKRGAILPFNSVISSDHRPIFLDIDVNQTFQSPLSSLVQPSQRSLTSTNLKKCNQYISNLSDGFERHRIFQRIQHLDSLSNCHDPSTIQHVEALDRDITRLMISCEKRLTKPSPTPFSSKLAQACILVSLLKLRYSELKYNKDYAASIQRTHQRLANPPTLPTTLSQTHIMLRDARKDVKLLRKHAVALREEFLISKESDPDVRKIVKRIRRAEELKRGYIKLRFLLRPSNQTLVTQLEVPSNNTPPKQATTWTRLTDPEDVTNRLLQRNTAHFGSAQGTPFTVPPLSQDFDWSAKSSHHYNVLRGSFTPYNDPLLNKLLHRLRQRVSPSKPQITLHEFVRRLRRWKETTSTSPSRRHLGHYKSLLPPPSYTPEEYLSSQEGKLLSVHLSMLNFCARTGYSLQRWHKIVTMMIPKEHNNFKIHRLRVIHLYEADLTALFSIWSKKMIHNATDQQSLNSGSYGARPGRTSIDPAFISVLQTEIATITRTNLILAPNDAAQCYDRIIPNHALLSCMSHGMPPTAASCIGNTLKNAKYYLKTALNESSTYWTNTPSTPIYGTGQGSGISPGVCCVTFSDLFDVHADISTGSTYTCPINSKSFTIHNVGFVDDTTTSTCDHSSPHPHSPSQLIHSIQQDLQNWSDLLHLSGGALEFSKTELFLLNWKFNSNGNPYLSSDETHTISLSSPMSNHCHSISTTSPHDFYKLLGFHLSPSLSMLKQYQVLHSKSHRIANAIAGSTVTRREAYLAYFAVFQPAISYVLVLTSFTKKQCHHLQSKPTSIFLQKCGFSATTHRSIVYGPRCLGGLGFRDIHTTQGILHVMKFIQTLRTPGQPCNLLRLLLTEWQIHSGSSLPLLAHPNAPCTHLEGSWLSTLRNFLATINGSIRIHDYYCPQSPIHNDIALMDAFHTLPGIGRKRMMHLNYCRLFLKVHFLSEIVTSHRTHLRPGFWTGDSIIRPQIPLHKYPRQDCPSPTIWAFWRHCIRRLFCYPRSTRLRHSLRPVPSSSPSIAPSCDVYSSPVLTPLSLSNWQLDLLHHINVHEPPSTLLPTITTSLQQQTLLAATDGGSSSTNASFGWTLRCSTHDLVSCFGPVHGRQPTAFRAEVSGLLSLITFLHSYLTCHHWVSGHPSSPLHIYLDNKALLSITNNRSTCPPSPSVTTSSEYDLLLQLFDLLSSLPIPVRFHHVKSHQDNHQHISTLSDPAQANCCADQLATRALSQCTSCPHTPLYPASQCTLSIGHSTITRSPTHTMQHAAFANSLRTYILASRSWKSCHYIDWTLFASICTRNSFRLTFLIKWIHRLLPTGPIVHRRQPSASPFCPACGQLEGPLHFLSCSHPSRIPLHRNFLTNLRKCLTGIVTDPNLKLILLEGVNHILTGSPPPSLSPSSKYHTLIISQTDLGWDNLLRGFLSTEWLLHHQQFCHTRSSPPSSTAIHPFISPLNTIINEVQSIWNFRCAQRHSQDLTTHESERRRQARQQLTELYQLRPLVLPTDKLIYKSDLCTHLQDDLSAILAWLHNHSSHLHASVDKARSLHLSNMHSLTTYFQNI